MTLPISVIVPHLPSRDDFFTRYCKPTIDENQPAEVLVVLGDQIGPQRARNQGAAQATQPFLFFCDDDVRLRPDCLTKMHAALERDKAAGFAYSDHEIRPHATMTVSPFVAGPFDPERLRRTSYISTMSLMRREVFKPWDTNIRRMQDWDFWLSIVEKSVRGVYIPEPLFAMHVIDKNITATWTAADWLRVVREKHGLPEPKK